jgi:hypothetical protein
MGTEGTDSNVERQLQNLDTRGHETKHADKREDESRRFSAPEKGGGEEMVRRHHDEFRDCFGTGDYISAC